MLIWSIHFSTDKCTYHTFIWCKIKPLFINICTCIARHLKFVFCQWLTMKIHFCYKLVIAADNWIKIVKPWIGRQSLLVVKTYNHTLTHTYIWYICTCKSLCNDYFHRIWLFWYTFLGASSFASTRKELHTLTLIMYYVYFNVLFSIV